MIEVLAHVTPIGEVRIALRSDRLVGLAFVDGWPRIERQLLRRFGDEQLREVDVRTEAEDRLDAYMAGDLGALAGLAVDARGSNFQHRVWSAIRDVPAGQTLSYARLALAAGAPNAVRAAGTACGANPIGLVIPCHRIVRADGDPGNYGGGLQRKRWLLAHEHRHAR